MNRFVTALCLAGLSISGGVLTLGFEPSLAGFELFMFVWNFGVELFLGGIAIASFGMTLAALYRRIWTAALTAIAVNLLFALTFAPSYVEHNGKAGMGPTHRHTLWEFGHVH